MGYRVAVVGATGAVGREMLNILEELEFPVDEIHAIASRKSIGEQNGIHAAGACRSDAVETYSLIIEQAIDHAPCKCAVTATALKRQVEDLLPGDRCARLKFGGLGLRGHD